MNIIREQKEELKELIKNVPFLLINDIESFLYLRSERLKEFKELGLGGGNLLSLLGQFSILNYIAKVYQLLTLKWNGEGKINEEDSFSRLIKDFTGDLGISKKGDEASNVWKWFRNKMSHMATLPNGKTALTFEYPNTSFREAKEIVAIMKNKPFTVRNNNTKSELFDELMLAGIASNIIRNIISDQCNVDLLNRDLKKIIEWLCAKIDSNDFTNKGITNSITWIKSNQYE